MPYLVKDDKDRILDKPEFGRASLANQPVVLPNEIFTPGELNYAVTELVRAFLANQGPLNYSSINAAVGALECAKLELYRRVAVPYENLKATANGDVYE